MKNAIIYVLVFLGLQAGTTIIVQQLWKLATGSNAITATMLAVSMGVFCAVTFAVFVLAKWFEPTRAYLRSRPWAALIWSALAAVGAVIPSTWLQEQMPELPNLMEDVFSMILKDPMGYLAVGLLAPFVEEVVFRGAVLRSLLNSMQSRWWPIVISSLLFALVHGNPVQMPHAFLVGLLLGWLFCRTGSIIPGVVYHWVNNTVAYIAYNVLPHPDADLAEMFGGSEHAALLAVGCSLLILIPALFRINRLTDVTD